MLGGGSNKCQRLACADTSALYLCNDNATPVAPSCNYLAQSVSDIYYSCKGDALGLSGQEYDSDGYNVVTAYRNCYDSEQVRPDQYAGPGPNGNAGKTCTNCIITECTDAQNQAGAGNTGACWNLLS